jgi:hypothetical protein
MHGLNEDDLLEDTIRGLHNGDFSRLEPRLTTTGAAEPDVIRWHREGRFQHDSNAVAEVLTCACFLGLNDVVEYLLAQGVDPSAGAGTGMDALHWATNRGQLETVRAPSTQTAPRSPELARYDGPWDGNLVRDKRAEAAPSPDYS